ncbi:YCF48-related protein [Botrimarina sp.]|uniref:YCF48-related protein n=1 Tax=Botrimarina sp. TaxID=2795802 RepID=UPI0032ED1031
MRPRADYLARLLLGLLCAPAGAGAAAGSLDDVLAGEGSLRDVDFVDASRGVAVGDRGLILHTDDGGRTWRRAAPCTDSRLDAASFVDEQHVWAVGGTLRAYTHESRGVVAASDNGGRDWRVVSAAPAPRLRTLRMFDLRHGVAAGDSTPAAPSGVWATDDGGQTWRPLAGEAASDWLAGDFLRDPLGEAAGVVAGLRGAIAGVAGMRTTPSVASGGRRGGYAVALGDSLRGWLVGDGGMVRTTADGGVSWAAPPRDPPVALGEWFNWRAVACRGDRVWVAGSPGSILLHTADSGQTWTASPTGVTTPITAIDFVDERRGWAVGEFGVILATSDGGMSWTTQRAAPRRAALMVVAAGPEDLPAEALASAAAAGGYRTAIALPLLPESPGAAADEASRAALAGEQLGADALAAGWSTPLRPADRTLRRDRLLERLDRLTDSQAAELLAGELQLALLAYRPDVVVVAGDGGAAELLAEATLTAADRATKTPPAAARLPPWTTRRVARIAAAAPAGLESTVHRLPTGDFLPSLGATPSGWRHDARGLLADDYAAAPAAFHWWTVAGDTPPSAASDLLSGINLDRGGPARRAAAVAPTERLDQLRRVAQKRRNMERLLATTAGDPAWAGQVMNLTGGLDAESGAQLLRQLADGYREAGQLEQAAETLYLLARRYPESPLADAALVWLTQHYASGERRHAATQSQSVELRSQPSTLLSVDPASVAPPAPDKSGVASGEERLERAAQLLEYLRQARPALHARPVLRFTEAAVARDRGFAADADRIALLLSKRQIGEPWRRAAEAERWLADPEGLPPEKPLAACRYTPRRPLLDGALDEPAWRGAEAIRVTDPRSGEPAATVRFLRDEAFLFLAIEAPGAAPPEDDPSQPRPRDADLAERDRLSIRIDVDRDYATAYELAIDSRGWTHDALWGDPHWRPSWWVAAASDAACWRAEAAIPLSELVPADRIERAAWAVSLRRLRPAEAAAGWPAGEAADGSPDAYGLLLLD